MLCQLDVLVRCRPDYGLCGKAGLTIAARGTGAQKKGLWTHLRLQGFKTWTTIV